MQYEVTFQYQMTSENLYEAARRYRDFDTWSVVVRSAGQSAVQHACSNFTISSFQSQRGVIQQAMESLLKVKLEGEEQDSGDEDASSEGRGNGVYARAISLQLRDVTLPPEYKEAVATKQEAEEDIQLARNQRKQEVTKAETDLLAAKEQAR